MFQIPWYALVLSALIAGTVTYLLYRKQWTVALYKVAAVLRFTAVFLLVLLFFSPSIRWTNQQQVPPRVIIYTDASYSSEKSATLTTKKLKTLIAEKSSNPVNIQVLNFGGEILSADQKSTLSLAGQTRLDLPLEHLKSEANDPSITAAILVSDGIFNAGRHPLQKSFSLNVPLHCVGVGDSVVYPDAAIEGCLSNDWVFLGNSLDIELSLSAYQLNAVPQIITLKANGSQIQQQIWTPAGNKDFKKIVFNVTPTKLGWIRYEIGIYSLVKEKNSQNNIRQIWVQVSDQKKNIHLVYGQPHPDIKAMRLALNTKKQHQVTTYSIAEGIKPTADVYVFHGLRSRQELEQVKTVVESKKPFWFFVDAPSQMMLADGVFSVRESSASNMFRFQEVAGAWNDAYSLFLLEKRSENWRYFGAVNTPLFKISPSAGFTPQLFQQWNGVATEYPLFGTYEDQGVRSSWFLGTGIWRWRMNEFKNNENSALFDDWVGKNILWLASNSERQKSIKIQVSNREFLIGQPQTVIIQAFNEAGLLDNSKEITLLLVDSLGKSVELPVSKRSTEYISQLRLGKVGSFKLKAVLKSNPNKFDEIMVGCSRNSIEFTNLVADFPLLRQLSKRTNGQFVSEGNLPELVNKLQSQLALKSRFITSVLQVSWLQIIWVLILIVTLYSGEWFIRKWMGKI